MPFKVPNEGEIEFLKLLIANSNPGNWRVGLYKNFYTPTDNDTYNTYANMEADFPNYSRQQPTGWSAPTTNMSGMGQSTAQAISFQYDTSAGAANPNTIYGYFVVNGASKLLWAEQFMMPQNLGQDGDRITLTPTLMMCTFF